MLVGPLSIVSVSYCVSFRASKVMQLRNVFFLDVVLPDWMFVVKCFKIMHWPKLWGSLVQTLATNTQWLSTVLQKKGFLNFILSADHPLVTYAVSTSLLPTTPFPFDYLFIILVQQPYFLHICAFSIFFLQNFHKILQCFWPSLLGPTHTLWHIIYTMLSAFHINTLFCIGNCKTLWEVGNSSKVTRHGITSMYLSMFSDDCMRSVNPL